MNKQTLVQLGVGVLIGISFFTYSQFTKNISISGWFDDLGDSTMSLTPIDYSSVFFSDSPKNIFSMVYYKMYESPKESAITKVAKKYGLTKQEAELAIGGSLTVLLKNKDTAPINFTQKQAKYMLEAVQQDYLDYKDTFETQQNLDMTLTSSEIFSNGIITDSSFDLIHDLDVIEEILFKEVSPTKLSGDIFENTPSDNKKNDVPFTDEEEIENENAINDLFGEEEVISENNNYDNEEKTSPTYGDIENIDNEFCAPENDDVNIFDTYDETILATENEIENNQESDNNANNNSGNAPAEVENQYEYSDFVDKIDDKDYNYSQCYASQGSDDNSSFKVGLCVSIEYIMGKQSLLIIPGKDCIECSLKNATSYFEKTLSHSLMPNKLTGNLGENAKCKLPYKANLPLDINFITISVPIPTTPNTDIVTGGNPIDSWNKLMERSGYSEATIDQTETEIANQILIGASGTYEAANEKINEEADRVNKKNIAKKNAFDAAQTSENVSIFTKAIYVELDQFHSYLKNELELLKKVNNKICPALTSKKSI